MTMTPEQLREHAKEWDIDGRYSIAEIFRAHADALERKNPTKRRISVLQFQGHGETYGKLELSFNMAPQFPWVKVGECEIEE